MCPERCLAVSPYSDRSAAFADQSPAGSTVVVVSLVLTGVRPSTPFSADTDTPIFCCQPMTDAIPYASRADVAQRD